MKTMRDNLTVLRRYVFVSFVWLGLVVGASQVQAYPIVTYFDVVQGITGGPPYPSSPNILAKVFDCASPALATLPMEEVTLNYGVTPPELGTRVDVSDSGGGVGSAGTVATFVCYLKMDSPAPPATTAFDIFLKVDSPSGVQSIVSGPVTYGDSFFDVFFDVEMSDGGVLTHHYHGETEVGEALPLEDISFNSVIFDNPPAEAYDAFLNIEMNTGGAVLDPSIPLMTIELTGTYVPEPATLSLLALSGLALLRRKKSH